MCSAITAVVAIGAEGAHRVVRVGSTIVAEAVGGVEKRALVGAAWTHEAGAAVLAVAAKRARFVL